MATDNWPVDFRYISHRLVTEIVQQDQARRSRWRPSIGLRLRLLELSLQRLDLDYSNKFDLCRRATVAVSDLTGDLAYPGKYIRAELDVVGGLLTVLMGWEETHIDIASFWAKVDVPAVGSTLVALFGSASNFTSRREAGKSLREIPSDVDGLYGLLERAQEPSDPKILRDYLEDDGDHSLESRADLVLRLIENRFAESMRRRLDILARVFYVIDGYDGRGSEQYNRIIIGAPIWAATPEPQPIRAGSG